MKNLVKAFLWITFLNAYLLAFSSIFLHDLNHCMLDWKTVLRPILALAPMADMTDMPFCLLCKQYGDLIIFREMVSAEAIVRDNDKTWHMAAFDERERPIVQQVFGNDPAIVAEAARRIVDRLHPDGIDINMGCPVHKITSNFDGASLIRDPDKAAEIVQAVKNAVSVPVSVKTRLGWNNKTDILTFVKKLEYAGVDLVTVHGRTKEQGYSGKADWKAVGAARQTVPRLPFLVNGDIVDAATARQALAESVADGVMIGRGALGQPWIFDEIRRGVLNTPMSSDRTVGIGGSTAKDFANEKSGRMQYAIGIGRMRPVPKSEATSGYAPTTTIVLEHARLQVEHYGERGLIKLRKHLPYYFKGDQRWKELRSQLVRVSTMEELKALLQTAANL